MSAATTFGVIFRMVLSTEHLLIILCRSDTTTVFYTKRLLGIPCDATIIIASLTQTMRSASRELINIIIAYYSDTDSGCDVLIYCLALPFLKNHPEIQVSARLIYNVK